MHAPFSPSPERLAYYAREARALAEGARLFRAGGDAITARKLMAQAMWMSHSALFWHVVNAGGDVLALNIYAER